MSILDKHPGPWRFDDVTFQWLDARGYAIPEGDAERVRLAAPELLAALKEVIEAGDDPWMSADASEKASTLIDRIEKGEV